MAATAEFDGGSCLDLGPSRKESCPIASGLDKKKTYILIWIVNKGRDPNLALLL
jgi:hypothetical protein